jgi:uncharacterized protein
MRIAVTGSSGLIGSALVASLTADGHDVVRLVRGTPTGPGQVQWDPAGGTVDLTGLQGIDAAVHMAGAGVADHRWTAAYKREIHDSRVLGTRTLIAALTALDTKPAVLISGAAIGYYGPRGDEVLTETSTAGDDFLARVVKDWEAETKPASDAGIRVATTRTGLVMSRSGGAFQPLKLLTKLGLGGPIGNGRQWWSWITLDDEVAALRYLIDHDVSGPVNLTGPQPVPNREVMRELARAMKRPALVPAPAFALKLVLGEFANDVLASQRVVPQVLLDSGFTFRHPTIAAAARWAAS